MDEALIADTILAGPDAIVAADGDGVIRFVDCRCGADLRLLQLSGRRYPNRAPPRKRCPMQYLSGA